MTIETKASAIAPATCANLSVGFDLLGMSVPVLFDKVTLTKTINKDIIIKSITGDDGLLSQVVEENTAGMPVKSMLEKMGTPFGIEIEIEKGIPLSSGLGGSAASAVAAVVAMNYLCDDKFSQVELLEFAMDGEMIASGSRHMDNVGPCLYGGLVACLQSGQVIPLPTPKNMQCLLIHPQISINTKEARDLLKNEITKEKWIEQSSNLIGFMTGIWSGQTQLIFDSLKDCIITPQRKHLIKPFDAINELISNSKGSELGISGAGPTMFALFDNFENARHAYNKIAQSNLMEEYHLSLWVQELPAAGAKLI